MKIGTFSWKFNGTFHWGDLLELTDFDKRVYSVVGLDEGEKLYRYSNDKTKISKIEPLIKINVDKKLIYFISDRGMKLDMAHFEKRGIKLNSLVFDEVCNDHH